MRTIVIGTAGHIDHGKTTVLRALTGIDADRLPEERARGMTIDVGFAHLDLDDGTALDFVDVPGHDRLVGNMLVGAGEIDAVLLVVAADDGPRAQTLEHLELLDALGLTRAVVAITKADIVEPARAAEVAAAVRGLLARTSLGGGPIVEVSSTTGVGLPELRHALVALRDSVWGDLAGGPSGPPRLPIDRAFRVKGRGLVVTGTLRGGSVAVGAVLRTVPGRGEARVREVQVRHGRTDQADGGRTALNLVGLDADAARRGVVLTSGAGVSPTDSALVALRPALALRGDSAPSRWPPRQGARFQLHLWTETVEVVVRPTGARFATLPRDAIAAIVTMARPIAVLRGARAVLRDPGSGRAIASAAMLDSHPPRGVARRRMTPDRLGAVASALAAQDGLDDALVELHGFLVDDLGRARLALDVEAALASEALTLAAANPTMAEARAALARRLRRLSAVDRGASAAALAVIDALLDRLVAGGGLRRVQERLLPAADADEASAVLDARGAALARLEVALDVDVPPSLAEAARTAGCAPDAAVALERDGRIVRVDDDLAWATPRYLALRARALEMAGAGPLAPASFRDAIGGNRRIVLAFLEDLDRKGFLRRTDAGHVPGPRASEATAR